MYGVIIEFEYGAEFDPARIAAIARDARGHFERLPALRLKAFTIDAPNRRATNVYLWESEALARRFFTDELLKRVTGLYGVQPAVRFVEVAELVDNTEEGIS